MQEVDVVDYLGNGVGGMCTPYIDVWERTKKDTDLYSRIQYAWKYTNPTASLKCWEQDTKAFPYNHNSLVDKENALLQTIYHEYGHSILGGKVSELLGTNAGVYSEIQKIEDKYKSEKAKYQKMLQEANMGWGSYKDISEAEREKAVKEAKEKLGEVFVSKYASDSTGEFIAECFANASLCSNPSKYSVQVVEVLKKYFGK